MHLRPYQEDLVARVRAALNGGSVVMQLPTGGGKTVNAAEIAMALRRRGRRVWLVCHRRELVGQICGALDELNVPHGRVVAGDPVDDVWQIQVCSIGVLKRALKALTPPDLVIWDECQHVPAKSWSEIRALLSKSRHLGLTATPARLDGRGLAEHFDDLVCGPDTRWLIEHGFLAPYKYFAPTIPDMRGVRTRMGEYDRADVEREMDRPVLVGDVVEHYRRLAPDARAIAFCCSVKASRTLAERFEAAGSPAQHVDGATLEAERDAAVAALRSGEIKVLCNVDLFTEGFDAPAVDAVILLRPTKSYARCIQMIGRGLRNAPGKACLTVLDHAGLVHEHGLPDDPVEWSLDGFRPLARAGTEDGAPRLRRCPECSAVHGWAAECPECGHAYGPEERASLDEVYGELRRVDRSAVPDGCETVHAFAKRIGIAGETARALIEKGLPNVDGHPLIIEGVAWFEAAPRPRFRGDVPINCEAVNTFSKRIGTNYTTVLGLIRKGLPNVDGYPLIDEGVAWFNTACRPRFKNDFPIGCVSVAAFAKCISVSCHTVKNLLKNGLPNINGYPLFEEGKAWFDNAPRPRYERDVANGCETIGAFSTRIGRSDKLVCKLIERGLPNVDGNPIIAEGVAWFENAPRPRFRGDADVKLLNRKPDSAGE